MTASELRAVRGKRNLTQAAIAKIVGVTANTVARWERGELRITIPMQRLISFLLGEKL